MYVYHLILEPLIENTHYLKANNPTEFREKINSMTVEKWVSMSIACHEWYMRNIHSKNCWKTIIQYLLFSNIKF